MYKKGISYPVILVFFSLLMILLAACNGNTPKAPPVTDIVIKPEDLARKTSEDLRALIDFAAASNNHIGDSIFLFNTNLVKEMYEKNRFEPVWSKAENYSILADSMLHFIANAKLYGLFPEDYHFTVLDSIHKGFLADSSGKTHRKDAALWSRSDILLTDAFFHVINDLKLGRLPNDSVTLRKDSLLADDFFLQRLSIAQKNNSLALVFHSLEPTHLGYQLLKRAIPAFLEKADDRILTVVPSPKDGLNFKKALQTRLFEGGYLSQDSTEADSAQLVEAVKNFQKQQNIAVDGRVGEGTVRALNTTDRDRFVRIAISMDRYKLLPETMPDRFVWVNLPAFSMRLQEGDSVTLVSKIICGKPLTRTPLLTSSISELITYPQWTIPTSIIVKEILPAVKNDPGYLARKGFSLINGKGEEVDPFTVEWKKYTKGIPYKVVQGSGDANALGILKFNFPNKYAVYLHDTNQRYLFSQAMRSLSHGCVRVQEWDKLAYNIIRYDFKDKLSGKTPPVEDSLNAWLERKEKHSIPVRNRLPLYIRYVTCEAKADRIVFYDDIYGEDKALQQRFFAGK